MKRSQRAKPQKEYQTTKAKSQQWQESLGINSVKLTESQKELSNKIIDNDMTVCVAPAGTGKSYAVLYTYVKEYLKDPSKQIIVIRTPVQAGMDDVGHLPDSLEAKIEPHFASSKVLLETFLSKGKVETDLGRRIHFKIPNFMIGCTLDNSLVMIDEAQQIPPLILKLLLERIGQNSKVVVLGDNTQLYTTGTGRNGLRDLLPRFFNIEKDFWEAKYDYCAYHEFEVEDVQRSEFVKNVIRAYS